MTLKNKSSKIINVLGEKYRYIERRGDYGFVFVDAKIENMQKLVVTAIKLEPFKEYEIDDGSGRPNVKKILCYEHGTSGSNEVARRSILAGISLGWKPKEKLKNLEISLKEENGVLSFSV